jgi:outer membrane protein assembly factor BamB
MQEFTARQRKMLWIGRMVVHALRSWTQRTATEFNLASHTVLHYNPRQSDDKEELSSFAPYFCALTQMRNPIQIALVVLFFAARSAFAGDWAQFLGPHANGISDETGLLDKWPETGPRVIWDKSIGTGYGAPSVIDQKLVYHQRIGDEEIVECLNADTGVSQWHYNYPSHFVDPYGYNNGPRSTPLLTSNACYTFGAEGKLTCLELQTGKVVWQRDTGSDFNVPEAFFGVGSTPILEGGLLIVMVGGQPNSCVVAFDPATGKTVWQGGGESNWEGVPKKGWPGEPPVHWNPVEKQASYSTPYATTIHRKRQILCLTRQGLISLDPKTGAVNFCYWFSSRVNESVNAMRPVVVDDMIFISAAYYKIGSVLLRVNPDDKSVSEVWRGTSMELHWTTPIYLDGYLYACSGRNEPDARMRCVEFKTGKLMWDVDERWLPHSTLTPGVYGRGSSILADGKLITLGEGGILGLFKPNPEKQEEICRFQLPQLHHPSWAAPVLSRKKLYLRSEDHLVCVDLAK